MREPLDDQIQEVFAVQVNRMFEPFCFLPSSVDKAVPLTGGAVQHKYSVFVHLPTLSQEGI